VLSNLKHICVRDVKSFICILKIFIRIYGKEIKYKMSIHLSVIQTEICVLFMDADDARIRKFFFFHKF